MCGRKLASCAVALKQYCYFILEHTQHSGSRTSVDPTNRPTNQSSNQLTSPLSLSLVFEHGTRTPQSCPAGHGKSSCNKGRLPKTRSGRPMLIRTQLISNQWGCHGMPGGGLKVPPRSTKSEQPQQLINTTNKFNS